MEQVWEDAVEGRVEVHKRDPGLGDAGEVEGQVYSVIYSGSRRGR